MSALLFLGGGRITAALIAGLRRSGYKGVIVVHDRHRDKVRRLEDKFGICGEENLASAMRVARTVIIAVRPESVSYLLQEIANEVKLGGISSRPWVMVSVAAGVRLASLRAGLGSATCWARAMPSPVCRSGRGLTALAFDRGMPKSKQKEIRRLFARLGDVVMLPERQFDAFTVAYSSSHGYHALATLAGAAEKFGLPRNIALAATAHALADGIVAWREKPQSLGALIEEAATPGGTAAATMAAMDARGYKRAVESGLRAGIARAGAGGAGSGRARAGKKLRA
jgi:pyrroline-5-carboxylate reductase